ncbi:MAG TPA: endonuclease VII domain-containing protein [Candidatus Saccharimonadales bacterium]
MKKCSICKLEKPYEDFNKDQTVKDGYNRRCRSCAKAEHQRWYDKDPERARRIWREAYGRYDSRNKRYKRKYKISAEEVDRLLFVQDYKCAICKKVFENNFNVDHNHSTNVVRGLLCTSCNQGIGMLRDDVTILRSAINYLT